MFVAISGQLPLRQVSGQVEWENRKTHWYEAVSSALSFPFLKKTRRMALILMLSSTKTEKVLQNCLVLDVVVQFKVSQNCLLSTSKIEEVSKKSFVFKLADRQIDKQTDRD